MRLTFNLGGYLKKIRLEKKLTQSQVAEKAKIDEKHYGRIERNVCSPTVYTLVDLGIALETADCEILRCAHMMQE